MAAIIFSMFAWGQNPDPRMKTFVDALMKKMTLEEKIGQLNLPGAGDITTGQASNSGRVLTTYTPGV